MENLRHRGWLYCYLLLFGLAYAQSPLFESNQNTKFISGLAQAQYRDVAADWMAGITDPFPMFSHLLVWQYRLLGLYVGTHLSFVLLLSVFGFCGLWSAKSLLSEKR